MLRSNDMNEMTNNIKDFFAKNFFAIAAAIVALIGTYFTVKDNSTAIDNLRKADDTFVLRYDDKISNVYRVINEKTKTFDDYKEKQDKNYEQKEIEYRLIIMKLSEQLHKQDKEIVKLQTQMDGVLVVINNKK